MEIKYRYLLDFFYKVRYDCLTKIETKIQKSSKVVGIS